MGVLPYTYSELILERSRAKDHTLAEFLDIFNHRAVSLFYRAWQKPRFPVTYSSGTHDHFTHYLLDLIGLGTEGLRDRQEIEDEALLHYTALLGMQARSATALEQIIQDYFEVPVEVQQFTGGWYGLDTPTQCAMNDEESASCQIGVRRSGGRRGVGPAGARAHPSRAAQHGTLWRLSTRGKLLRSIARPDPLFQQSMPGVRGTAGAR